jgi:rhodanese-related sulfurtransferase
MSPQRTTTVYAVITFLTLSAITFAMTRPKAPPASFATIGAAELKSLHEKGKVTVLDVRSLEQFSASHIPGALQIPLTRVEGEIPYLKRDKLIVTYCTCPAEESSGEAVKILAHAGIEAVALQGGLGAWTSAGYPTATGVQ